MMSNPFLKEPQIPAVAGRYRNAVEALSTVRNEVEGEVVLDFGSSYGLSILALLEAGAREVVGVEPEGRRVEKGRETLAEVGVEDRARILHVEDTRELPFADGTFRFILVNGVLEHIPQPRDPYIRELWRVLEVGGSLLVLDTPNKYLPLDLHTTGLWGVPWMPSSLAHRYAVWRGRFRAERTDWDSSGWRGLGHRELVKHLPGAEMLYRRNRSRHQVLSALGLPPTLLDPYPWWQARKASRVEAGPSGA